MICIFPFHSALLNFSFSECFQNLKHQKKKPNNSWFLIIASVLSLFIIICSPCLLFPCSQWLPLPRTFDRSHRQPAMWGGPGLRRLPSEISCRQQKDDKSHLNDWLKEKALKKVDRCWCNEREEKQHLKNGSKAKQPITEYKQILSKMPFLI